jgi:hypothetical protein
MIGGTSGSATKLCQPCSSQSKITQTRSSSAGSRKIHEALEVLHLRRCEQLSISCTWMGRAFAASSSASGGENGRPHRALLRIDGAEALDDLETAARRLGQTLPSGPG